jgi:hypothetical protein
MSKIKPIYIVFNSAAEAQSFLNNKYKEAKAIVDKYSRKIFWLELKASVEFRIARSFLGKKKPAPYLEGVSYEVDENRTLQLKYTQSFYDTNHLVPQGDYHEYAETYD